MIPLQVAASAACQPLRNPRIVTLNSRACRALATHITSSIWGQSLEVAMTARPGARSRPAVRLLLAVLVLLAGCGAGQPLRGAAAAQGHGRDAGAAAGHALSRGDRQHRGGEQHQPGRPRCRLPPGDQLQGRRSGQAGRHALHHRARALQAEARAGAGRRGERRRRRCKQSEAEYAAADSILPAARSPPRQRSRTRSPTAMPARPSSSRRRPTPSRRRSISATPR